MGEDRTVHARCAAFEVVRYDRSGKWYVEPLAGLRRAGGTRRHVGVKEAAQEARRGVLDHDGTVTLGLSGGAAFDRAYVQEQA